MKVYETSQKFGNEYRYMGWYPMNEEEEKRCIRTIKRTIEGQEYLYKRYKTSTGDTYDVRYGRCKELSY